MSLKKILDLLRCPNRLENGNMCLSSFEKIGNLLRCPRCNKEYEIKNEIPVVYKRRCPNSKCKAPVETAGKKCRVCGTKIRYEIEELLNIYYDAHFGRYIQYDPEKIKDTYVPYALTEGFYQSIAGFCAPYIDSRSLVLDLGCATGRLSLELAKYSQYAIGLDASWQFVTNALKIVCSNEKVSVRINDIGGKPPIEGRLKGFGIRNCCFIVADAHNIPFDESTFDLVLSVNLIDRVPEPIEMISQAHRVLKANGRLVITDPFDWGEKSTQNELYWKGHFRDFLPNENWKIESIVDGIPFILRHHSRYAHVYYNQLAVARRV